MRRLALALVAAPEVVTGRAAAADYAGPAFDAHLHDNESTSPDR